MLGGSGYTTIAISQSIIIGPPYYSLTVSFSLYQLDTWALADWTASINGTTYLSYGPSILISTICGVLSSHNSTQSFTAAKYLGSNVVVNYTTPYASLLGRYSRFAMRNFVSTVLLCNSRCIKCTSYTVSACTICIDNANLTSGCLCNTGYYNSSCGTNNQPPVCVDQCLPCDVSCLTCSNGLKTGCTSCPPNNTLSSGSCIPNCAGGTALTDYVEADGTCESCISPCVSCLNATYCYSCISDYYLHATTGQCLTNCPDGTYGSSASMSCQGCDQNCLTCSGSATNCASCSSGLSLASNNSCMTCWSGTYLNILNNSCLNCYSLCETCNGSTAQDCLSCNSTELMVVFILFCNNNSRFERS